MAPVRTAAATVENNSQYVYPPMKFLGLRVRYWARGVVPSLALLGTWLNYNPIDVNFNFFSGSDKEAKVAKMNVTKLDKLSQLKFNVKYKTGLLPALENADTLSEAEVTKQMATAYKMDTLSTQQVFANRLQDSDHVVEAQEEAMDILRDELDIGELVPTKRYVTSGYGASRSRKVKTVNVDGEIEYKKVSGKHGGHDIKFWQGEPVSSNKPVTYIGTHRTSDGINMTRIMDGDEVDADNPQNGDVMLELLHDAAANIGNFIKGDVVPAGKAFAVTGPRDAHSTGTHIHVQAKVYKNGKWKLTDPRPYAKQFMDAPGFSETRKKVPSFFAQYLEEAGYDDFEQADDIIASMRKKREIGPKTAKFLNKTYQAYEDKLDDAVDSLVMADVLKDRALLAAAFRAPVEERSTAYIQLLMGGDLLTGDGTNAHVSSNAMAAVKSQEAKSNAHMQTASVMGALNLNLLKKKEEIVVKAVPNVEATENASSAGWGRIYQNLLGREHILSDILKKQELMNLVTSETGLTAEEIADDIMGVVTGHEDPDMIPDAKNAGSSAVGFGQHTIDNRETLHGIKRFNLPPWPSRSLLKTEKGINIQAQYLLAHYCNNFNEARNNDDGIYNKTYVRSDNGEPVFMSYRRAATTGWAGIYGLNKNLAKAQKKAQNGDHPYALFSLHMEGQNFTSYVGIMQDDEAKAAEDQVRVVIAADPNLTKYYYKKNKQSVSKKQENVSTTTSQMTQNFTTSSTDTLNRAVQYDYQPN